MQIPAHSVTPLLADPFWHGVQVNELYVTLPLVEDLIKAAVKSMRGRMDYEDVVALLYSKQWQLWVAGVGDKIECCVITEIVVYSKMKVCSIHICTGKNRYHWQSFITILENWAISQGCKAIEAIARKGWSRILKDWEPTHVFIEKQLIGKPDGKFLETTNHNN